MQNKVKRGDSVISKSKMFGIEVDKIPFENQKIDDIEFEGNLYYDPLKSGDNYIYRYCLDINLLNSDKKDKEITVILFNPSEYNLSKNNKNVFIDKTITNVIKIINDDNRFAKIRILNLFPTINTKPKDLIKSQLKYSYTDKKAKEVETKLCTNFKMIENIKDSTILLAWGQIASNIKSIKVYKKELCEKLSENNNLLLTFCPVENNYPKHPGRLDLDCCRNCFGRSGKIRLIEFKP